MAFLKVTLELICIYSNAVYIKNFNTNGRQAFDKIRTTFFLGAAKVENENSGNV